MNTFEIVLRSGDIVEVEADTYVVNSAEYGCLVSFLDDNLIIAVFKDWVYISIVRTKQ